MDEQKLNQGTGTNDDTDEQINGGELDLGSEDNGGFDPFGDNDFADEEIPVTQPEEPAKPPKADKPVKKADSAANSVKKEIPANPLEQALAAAETKDAETSRTSLFAKPPVFVHGSATEDVDDPTKTFEELRIEKSVDFPELEDGKKVSWTVVYGTITKPVTNPKDTAVGKIKSEIETSKEFLDALKKAKDKNPSCQLKPKIIAQSKGKASAYKGVFTSYEEADKSNKVITLFPARDGKVYEMRKTEMGNFLTPSLGNEMLSEARAGFYPALPFIPNHHLLDVISFFRLMALHGDYEALVNVYWDKETEEFILDVPSQTVTSVSVDSEVNPAYDSDRYIHYMDIHSHNRMKAFFSSTDDRDEKATRVYAVIGRVFDYFPQIRVRISNGGTFCEIKPDDVFEDLNRDEAVTEDWFNRIEMKKNKECEPDQQGFAAMLKKFAETDKAGEDE